MRFAVIVFPGTWSDHDSQYSITNGLGHEADLVWHRETDLSRYDVVVLPGGFSYGDYLRTGAIARFSPVMDAVAKHAEGGQACHRHLQRLPGALRGTPPARRAHAQRVPAVPLRLGEPPHRQHDLRVHDRASSPAR